MQQLCRQHDLILPANQELKSHLTHIVHSDALLAALSQFQDKVKIELNIELQQFITVVRQNGYEVLANFLESHNIVQFNTEVDGLRITMIADQSVQWKEKLSDETSGFLSLKQKKENDNLHFYAYNPKTNDFRPIGWKCALDITVLK